MSVVLRLAILIVAVAVGIQSLLTVWVQVSSADHRLLANQIEAGRRPDLVYLQEFDAKERIDAFSSTCRRDLMRGMISLSLSLLDAAIASRDIPAIDAARDRAVRALEDALACDPLDGNAWLRLAMIDLRFTGPTDRVLRRLSASQWSMPGEGWVLLRRLLVLVHLVSAGVSTAEPLLRADVRRYARGGNAGSIERFKRNVRGRAAIVIEDELALISGSLRAPGS